MNELQEAANLLLSKNLVWSDDMERIRKPLGAWLHIQSERGEIFADHYAVVIAKNLLDDDDITIPNPLEEYRAGKSK